jgi:hypothetical protein
MRSLSGLVHNKVSVREIDKISRMVSCWYLVLDENKTRRTREKRQSREIVTKDQKDP